MIIRTQIAEYLDQPPVALFQDSDFYNRTVELILALSDPNSVTSVNGQIGVVVLDTDDISEGSTNLYDKTVVLTNGTGISVTGTYPNFTITNTSPSTVTPAALTKTDDTNVTLALGGTPTTALLQATSLTLGWTGTLADSRITSASTWNAKQPAGNYITALTGDVTASGPGSVAATIANNAITYAKIQAVSTTSKLLGSSSTTTPVQEITLGTGLSLTGTTLTASGTGGTVTSVTAGTGLSGGVITTTGTVSMPNTGTAGTYGDSTHVPVLTTDAQGRITSATNTAISGATVTPYAEVPYGTVNSINTVFTLANTPSGIAGVIVLLDGIVQYNGVDYTVSGTTITFSIAPVTGSSIFCYYNTLVTGSIVTIGQVVSGSTGNGLLGTDGSGNLTQFGIGTTLLSTTTGIDATLATTTNLYTVPVGKTTIPVFALIKVTTATSISIVPTLGIGIAAGESDIYTPASLTGMTTTGKIFTFMTLGTCVSGQAGDIIKLGIDVGASATVMTISVYLFGYNL